MSTQTISRKESFLAFRERYKPLIRPDETLPRMRRALSVDAEFIAEFTVLRGYLRPMLQGWTEALLGYLYRFPELRERFGAEEEELLRPLIRQHSHNLAAGHFDEHYLNSLEDIALYFIYFDVKSIWVAGAYQAITRDAIDIVFKRATDRHAIRVRQLMKILTSALALELNQIQRVYTVYERRQYTTLIEDLNSSAFLTDAHPDLKAMKLPALEPTDVMRVQDSYGSLRSQSDLFAKAFCKTLFEDSPETLAFAGTDHAAFASAFTQIMAMLVGSLSVPTSLAPTLARLGAMAAERGATPALYKAFEDALMKTLERASGMRWREEDAKAWREIYATLAMATIAASGAETPDRALFETQETGAAAALDMAAR